VGGFRFPVSGGLANLDYAYTDMKELGGRIVLAHLHVLRRLRARVTMLRNPSRRASSRGASTFRLLLAIAAS